MPTPTAEEVRATAEVFHVMYPHQVGFYGDLKAGAKAMDELATAKRLLWEIYNNDHVYGRCGCLACEDHKREIAKLLGEKLGDDDADTGS